MSDLRRFNRSFYLVAAVIIAVLALQVVKYGIWAMELLAR